MKKLEIQQQVKIPAYRRRYNIFLDDLQFKQYNLLLYGMHSLPIEERKKIDPETERTIIYNKDKTWKLINQLKQERLNKLLSHSLKSVFKNSLCGNAMDFLFKPITDPNFILDRDLKECEPSKEQIIHALMDAKILPLNFLK